MNKYISKLNKFRAKGTKANIVTDIRYYEDPAKNLQSSELEVNNWIISDFVINELYPITGYLPFPLSELMLMTTAITYFKPTQIFDWGTHIGKSARIFYEITKHFKIDAEIHSIDLPEEVDHVEHPHEQRGMMVKGLPEVHLHLGDGLDDSLKIFRESKSSRPFFLLDGDHSYESVKRELEGIYKEIENPVIIVHDTFYQSENSKYNIGPYLAVKEITNKNPNLKAISTNTGLPGMTLIFKK